MSKNKIYYFFLILTIHNEANSTNNYPLLRTAFKQQAAVISTHNRVFFVQVTTNHKYYANFQNELIISLVSTLLKCSLVRCTWSLKKYDKTCKHAASICSYLMLHNCIYIYIYMRILSFEYIRYAGWLF